jgi:hypothetical protein
MAIVISLTNETKRERKKKERTKNAYIGSSNWFSFIEDSSVTIEKWSIDNETVTNNPSNIFSQQFINQQTHIILFAIESTRVWAQYHT